MTTASTRHDRAHTARVDALVTLGFRPSQGLYRSSVEINRAAPARAVGETHIDADPQTVFSIIAGIDEWPSWNPDVKTVTVEGAVQPGTVFRWKTGPGTIVSTLQVVDRPGEIGWTGMTRGIRAIHVFRFEPNDGGTLAHSEESWDGALPRVLKGYSRRTLAKTITAVLAQLKAEAERRDVRT